MTERKQKGVVPGRVFYEMTDVAAALGWSTRRARRWLLREGVAKRVGGRWCVTKTALRRAFGETASDIIAALPE